MSSLLIIPPLILGVIIGLYELILVHRDENFRGSHWLSHGLHSAIWAIGAVFVTMNTQFVYDNLSFLHNVPILGNVLVLQMVVGVLTIIKVHAASAVVKTTIGSSKGLKETWGHSVVIGVLVVACPYVWPFIEPVLNPYIGGSAPSK